MPDDTMTIAERRQYLTRMQGRYGAATRPERGRLLDEMAVMTGLHRKSLLRLLRPGGLTRQPRRVLGEPRQAPLHARHADLF